MFLYCTFATDTISIRYIRHLKINPFRETAKMPETRKLILQRTEALFFKYGIKSVTMDDISRELGMSKKTLYQYFENKIDLLSQIMKLHEEHDITVLEKCTVEATDAIDEMLKIAQHATVEIGKMMSAQTTVYDMQKYYRDIWLGFEKGMNKRVFLCMKDNIERGKKEGLYRENVDAEVIAKLYVSKMFSIINEDMFPIHEYNKLRLFKQHLLYHIYGVATPKGIKLFEKRIEEMKL
jgi:TetR/AcrR family transcriptional regulator, cholesterol catabolism regulator